LVKSKYKREQQVKDDLKQSILNPENLEKTELRKKVTVTVAAIYTGLYRCPFCLHEARINSFLISTGKGYHRGLGKCPECGNQMQLKTLTSKMTPEQFAEFAYGYRTAGYWQKVKFNTFNQRLKELGINFRFWKRYKELKGEEPTEGYEDWLMRKQQEEHEAEELPDE
jgi:transcription elongation factor Elf1